MDGASSTPGGAPVYSCDFYGDAFIRDPWPHYARMRELGPVVWLPELDNFALTRYDAVRAALRDHKRFVSSRGVAGDAFGCEMLQGNTVASDPPQHTALRQAIEPPLRRRALEDVRPRVQVVLDEAVGRLVGGETFDAMADLARVAPLTVVRDLVGLPPVEQDKMLKWAAAAFDVLGVQNERGQAALEPIAEMRAFISSRADKDGLLPGSWTHRIACAADAGDLDPDLARFVIRDYINPSLDTTISAIGQLIWRLGVDPEQWALLKSRPELAPNAVHEAVRLGAPIRSFSRQTKEDVEIEGVTIPAGARVMMLYASANRDERVFENPDMFDVRRGSRRHLGFGAGVHMCVGMHLAQMEMEALLAAMIERVERIEVDSPEIALNNTIHAFARLPARFC